MAGDPLAKRHEVLSQLSDLRPNLEYYFNHAVRVDLHTGEERRIHLPKPTSTHLAAVLGNLPFEYDDYKIDWQNFAINDNHKILNP